MNKKNKTQVLTSCSMLLTLMLILGYVENRIPLVTSIPGIKLGLSNGVILFALYHYRLSLVCFLTLGKILLSAFLFSGFTSLPYAIAGAIFSITIMSLSKRVNSIHIVVVSILGGIFHNLGQVLTASFILGTPSISTYFVVLLPIGMITGLLTGTICMQINKHLPSKPSEFK